MSKIADPTCKIMRKFLFSTYSSFYVYLKRAIYVSFPLFDEMGQINYFTIHFCSLQLRLEFGLPLLLCILSWFKLICIDNQWLLAALMNRFCLFQVSQLNSRG